MSEQTLNLIKDNEARWVDLRFTDTRGKEQHVTIPSKEVDVVDVEDSVLGGVHDGCGRFLSSPAMVPTVDGVNDLEVPPPSHPVFGLPRPVGFQLPGSCRGTRCGQGQRDR